MGLRTVLGNQYLVQLVVSDVRACRLDKGLHLVRYNRIRTIAVKSVQQARARRAKLSQAQALPYAA